MRQVASVVDASWPGRWVEGNDGKKNGGRDRNRIFDPTHVAQGSTDNPENHQADSSAHRQDDWREVGDIAPRKGPTLRALRRARVSLDSSPTIDPGGPAPTAAYCNNGTKAIAHTYGRWHIHSSRRMQLHQYMACLFAGRSCAAMGWRHAIGSAAATRHGRLRRVCEKIGRCRGPGEAAAWPTPATYRYLVQSSLLISADYGKHPRDVVAFNTFLATSVSNLS